MTEPGELPPAPSAMSVSESGSVAVGGNVTISGAVAAGRDVVIERLSVIADDWAPSGDAATRPGAAGDECPYPGIQQFDERQRAWFVGRERDRRAALDRLERSDFLAVIGGSGSGKSSLLAAGIGPDFVDDRTELGETWTVRPLRPGPHPGTLLRRLVANAPPGPTLWLIDQLEETFARRVDSNERTDFLDGLCDIAAGRHGVAKVVVALRSDFYPSLDVHRGIADAVAADQHRLLPLDADALRDVILRPAELVGLRVEPALVEQVLADLEPGSNQLPLLAYAMRETWRRRRNGWITLAGYVDAGGVSEALENGARSVWDGLTTDQRATARRIFLRLTSAGEGRAAVRQRVMVDGLVTDRDDLDDVVDVLEQFTRERLVVPDQDDAGRATVDIAHEALLREWSVLRGWLDDDLDVRRLQRQLGDAAREWDDGGREPTGLFAGRRLQAVREGRRTGDITVNSTELAFIQAAENREHRDRRRTVLLTVLPLILVVAVAMAGFVSIQQRRTAQQKVVADALQLAAEARTMISGRRDAGALLAVAALRTNSNPTTLSTLIATVSDPDGPLAYVAIRNGSATALASSFTAEGLSVVGASDGSLRLVDPSSGREQSKLETNLVSVSDVAVATDGTIVAGGSHGAVAVVPRGRGQPTMLTGASSEIVAVRFDPASGLVVAGTADGTLWRWRIADDSVEPSPPLELRESILALELANAAAGGLTLVAATDAGALRRVDAASGVFFPPLEDVFSAPKGVSLAMFDGQLVVQSGDGIETWDLTLGEAVATSDEFTRATSLAVARSGDPEGATALAFTGTSSGEVQSWTLDPRPIPIGPARHGLSGSVERVATDGRTVVGLDDGQIIAWDVAGRRVPAGVPLTEQPSGVLAVRASPTGDIASGGRDGAIVLTSADGTSRLVADLDGEATGLAWRDPTTLVVGSDDGSVRTIDITSGDMTELAPAREIPIVDVVANAQGTVAFATVDGAITVIDDNRPNRTLTSPVTAVESLAVSPDGNALAVGTESGNTFVWNLTADGDDPKELEGHTRQVTSVAYSPTGDLLATGSDDQDIRLWSMPDGEERGVLQGHTDLIEALAFSLDGRLLVSGGQDYTMRIWDVVARVQIGEPWRWADATISDITIAADGRTLVAAHGVIVLRWAFGVDGWTEAACTLAGRDLTEDEWAELAPNHRQTTLCETG